MGFFDDTKRFFERKHESKADARKVVKSKQQVKINRKDEMSSVLDETEVQSAFSNMSKEPKLRAHDPEDETKPMYIAMKLEAKDIGGISIRRRKDKTIGQFVEAIKANRIMAYIPSELMAKNQLLIIPTPATLDAMSDFTMLTSDKLKYELAVVVPDGRGKATIGFSDMPRYVTYNTMREYVTDDDTNTPNQFLDQFHFFDEADTNGDGSATDAVKNATDKKAKLDDIPDDSSQSTDHSNQSTSTKDVLANSNSEGSNASTVGQEDELPDSATPFTMNGEPGFSNSNPTEKDNSGDVDVPSSQENKQNNDLANLADDPVTAGLNLGGSDSDKQDKPEESDNNVNNTDNSGDDFANDDIEDNNDQDQDDFASQDDDDDTTRDSSNDLDNDQVNDDFGGIESVEDANSAADNLAKAQGATGQSQSDVQVPQTSEELDKAIQRKFYGNNLNLQVTTEPIDLLLMNNNDIVPFDTDRGDGFLNQYLNQMSREANQSLLRKHKDNIAATRTFWYNAVVKGVEKIVSDVDDTNKDTKFGKSKIEIINNKNAAISDKKEELKPDLKKLDDDLENAAEKDARRAYDQAKQDYLDRFRGKTNAAKDQMLSRALDEINAQVNEKLKDLQDQESAQASQMYDQLVSEATNSAMNYYKKLRNGEHKSENEWRRKLRTYTDHHRKEQVAHDKALQAEIDQERESREQQKQFDAQMKKISEQMKTQKSEAERKIQQLEAQNAQDLEALRKENKELKSSYEQKLADSDVKHSREMADMKREYETKLNGLREEKQERITKLNSDHAEQLTKMREDNRAKVEQIKHEKDSKLRDIQQHNQDKVDSLTAQIRDLTQEIKRSQDNQEQHDKQAQHQLAQKDELVKNLRDEINNLNDDLSHVQGRAEDRLRDQMEAKYAGQLEMLKESNNNLKEEINRQKDESKTQASSSKSDARNLATIAAVVGALLGIGGSLLFSQNHNQSIQANQQEQIRQAQIKQAQEEQKSKDDARLDDAINRAIDRVQRSSSSNNKSNSHKNKSNKSDNSNSSDKSSNQSSSSNK